MAMVTSASARNNNLGDASFSSYLNGAEEPFVLKLAGSSQNLNSLITNSSHKHVYIGRKKVEDGEIGVFGAEKYFKGAMDEENPRLANTGNARKKHERHEHVDIGIVKYSPSVRSESSSNSQSALLYSISTSQPSRKTHKVHGKNFLANLACNCYCKDKEAIDIDEHIGVVHGKAITKQPINTDSKSISNVKEEKGIGLNKEDCFSFPILNSKEGNLAVKVQLQGEDTSRNSLDVFGSPILEKGKKSLNHGRKLNTWNWDSFTPNVEEIENPRSSNGMYNDTESDASSDLFEIESFSNNASPFLARQASNGTSIASCVTPTTCYAPSEASIEWSVVTASATDFSVASEYSEELRTAATTANRESRGVHNLFWVQKRRPSILSGCKSQKAVRVVGDAYITNENTNCDPRKHHGLYIQSHSAHSSHAPHLLYIQ